MTSYNIEQHSYRAVRVIDRDGYEDHEFIMPLPGSMVTYRFFHEDSIGVILAVIGYDVVVMWTPARLGVAVNVQSIRAVQRKLRVNWSAEASDDITK